MAVKLFHQDHFFEYYSDRFMDIEVQFRRNKFTDEVQIMFTDEMAQKIFGFEKVEDMINNPKIQFLVDQYYKETGQRIFSPNISPFINPN